MYGSLSRHSLLPLTAIRMQLYRFLSVLVDHLDEIPGKYGYVYTLSYFLKLIFDKKKTEALIKKRIGMSARFGFMTANLDSNDEHNFDTNAALRQWVQDNLGKAHYFFVGFQEDPDSTTSLSQIKKLLEGTALTYRQVRQKPVQWFLSAIGYSWIDTLTWLLKRWKTPNLYFFSQASSPSASQIKKLKCRWTCGFHLKSHFKGANIMAFYDPILERHIIVVNTHLYYAGYKKGVTERYRQFIEILRYLAHTFIPQELNGKVTLSACILVLMGDLNFRFLRPGFRLTDPGDRLPLTNRNYGQYFNTPQQDRDQNFVLRKPLGTFQANPKKENSYQLSLLLNDTLNIPKNLPKYMDKTTQTTLQEIRTDIKDDPEIKTVLRRIQDRILREDMFITCRYIDTRSQFSDPPSQVTMTDIMSLQKKGKARDPSPCDQILVTGPHDIKIEVESTVFGMERSDHLIRVATAQFTVRSTPMSQI